MQPFLSGISLPALIYIGMGIVLARILSDRGLLQTTGWFRWVQFSVDVLRIVLLWPLVLFTDKLTEWLAPTAEEEAQRIH
jgi:hypothetical protein